jgi:hypothetical protein
MRSAITFLKTYQFLFNANSGFCVLFEPAPPKSQSWAGVCEGRGTDEGGGFQNSDEGDPQQASRTRFDPHDILPCFYSISFPIGEH